jgi:hypothetical protein
VRKRGRGKTAKTAAGNKKSFILYLLFVVCCGFFLSSCGYRLIGSTPLPFHSVTIEQVRNKTYEPRLEEKMHNAFSKEFINQGIEVRSTGGEVQLEATVLNFQTEAVAAVDEMVKEQSIILQVNIKLTDHERVTEFKSMESPIKITFQSAGTVTETAAFKDRATDKACSEIAKEMVSRIILIYAK